MSYRKTFTKRIYVDYSGSKYASQAGTVHYSGQTSTLVEVVIDVDTDRFDESIEDCNTRVHSLNENVNLLTGAVVATEAAQVDSIRRNSRKVAHSIVSGFFKTVKSEITQQIAELTARIDADLIHLHEMDKRCKDKQRQMTVDYNRLKSNYVKIFDDLNKELENRIYELDRPTFKFRELSEEFNTRSAGGDLITTASVAATENSALQARINGARVKKDAVTAMEGAERFLAVQKRVANVLNHSLLDEEGQGMKYIPVIFAQWSEKQGVYTDTLYHGDVIRDSARRDLEATADNLPWDTTVDPDTAAMVKRYYDNAVAANTGAGEHDSRVAAMMNHLFNLSQTSSL